MTAESASDLGWPGGWVLSAAAGVIAAILAGWLGNTGVVTAVLVGLAVFVIFGVLLGMFWTASATAGGQHDHEQGLHQHHDESQDHGHDQQAPVYAAPIASPAPAASTPSASEANSVTEAMSKAEAKPIGLSGPRGGVGDALQTLEGIGPVLEKLCHDMGIYHFDQIAAWGVAETAWMDTNLKGFKGRVTRDKWVRQAKLIAEVGLEEFTRRAKMNDY